MADFEHPTEWGEAGAWNFLIKLSNLMQNFLRILNTLPVRGEVSAWKILMKNRTYFCGSYFLNIT